MKIRKLSVDAHEVIDIMVANKKVPMNEAQLRVLMQRPKKLPYVIKRLKKAGVMRSVPNLKDMRRVYYGIDETSLQKLREVGIR